MDGLWFQTDTANNIPPLISLTKLDVNYLDNFHNLNKENRRPTRKILTCIKIFCKHLDAIAEANGFNTVNKIREEFINFYTLVATVENAHTQWRRTVCPNRL